MAGAPPLAVPDDRTLQDSRVSHQLAVQRFTQPDDVTCGPTCLRKVYDFYGLRVEIEEIAAALERNEDGGTMAVFLGIAAMRRGFRARIYSYDLQIFDPTWVRLSQEALAEKVAARIPHLLDAKRMRAAGAYLRFLAMGGELSATYLYRMSREREDEATGRLVEDDVRGDPTGHFVVIGGYEHWGRRLTVMDPSEHVPFSADGRYVVDAQRLINAILLGDATYDAVLLEVWPHGEGA